MGSKNKKTEPKPGETPAWKQAQQKETAAKGSEDHLNEQSPAQGGTVKIRMKTDYRDLAKTGDIWETDAAKAAELVSLGRAEYV